MEQRYSLAFLPAHKPITLIPLSLFLIRTQCVTSADLALNDVNVCLITYLFLIDYMHIISEEANLVNGQLKEKIT